MPIPRPLYRFLVLIQVLLTAAGTASAGSPMNDSCLDALPIGLGETTGTTSGAFADTASSCDDGEAPDVWFRFEGPRDQRVFIDSSGSSFDTVLSIHESCSLASSAERTCDNDTFGSAAVIGATALQRSYIRLSGGTAGEYGDFRLLLGGPATVSGRVTNSEGEPLTGIQLTLAFAPSQGSRYLPRVVTDAQGRYEFSDVEPGLYHALTENDQGFINETHDGVICPPRIGLGNLCDLSTSTPITVRPSAKITDIDFTLDVGGTLSGVVRDRRSGEPIQGVVVNAYEGSRLSDETLSDAEGHYQLDGLTPGSYLVSANAETHADQVFDTVDCSFPSCLPEERDVGQRVAVESGQSTPGIDFDLPRRATLEGRVDKTLDGSPANTVQVLLFDKDRQFLTGTRTDSEGNYTIGGITPGSYFLQTDGYLYFNQIYPDHPCEPYCWGVQGGELITLTEDEARVDLDFHLDLLGSIRGRVTDAATGEPIAGIEVPGVGSFTHLLTVVTDEDGQYRWEPIEPGTHLVSTANSLGWIDEIYDDIPCPFSRCDRAPLRFGTGRNSIIENIDFVLERGGTIRGRLTDKQTGEPILGLTQVYDTSGDFLNYAFADEAGFYELTGLSTGSYFVSATSFGYLEQLYSGQTCPLYCEPTTGSVIEVRAGSEVGGVDFALEQPGGIRGTITDAQTGQPVRGASLSLYNSTGRTVNRALSDASGRYIWTGVRTGEYFVEVEGSREYFGQLHEGVDCPDEGCGPEMGKPIHVGATELTTGIDFALERRPGVCIPDANTLCLNNGRFRVTATWVTNGPPQTAPAIPLTAESGYFWFFNPNNVELVVKVLDGCNEPQNTFWVFAAGLTNVEVVLEITDTTTGDRTRYVNPQSQAFEPILDTQAFSTCP